jgi:hypothetical protein
MKVKYLVGILGLAIVIAGCPKVERDAYNTAVVAKAFLDTEKKAHPECVPGATTTICVDLTKAVAAKDVLLDALTIYCGGPNFATGGACDAPKKGTPGAQQAVDKLNAAVANYKQVQADLKGVK